jgi:hypothetical protein
LFFELLGIESVLSRHSLEKFCSRAKFFQHRMQKEIRSDRSIVRRRLPGLIGSRSLASNNVYPSSLGRAIVFLFALNQKRTRGARRLVCARFNIMRGVVESRMNDVPIASPITCGNAFPLGLAMGDAIVHRQQPRRCKALSLNNLR